jgi:DNA-binding Lrp family transcriptional regulator
LATVQLDNTDKALLTIVQDELPISVRPFDDLAEKLGITYEETMERVERLHGEGVIRRFGPVLETDRVGLSARTLVLMKVPQERIDEVAEIISGFESVTHNYERSHEYNMWFTLITSSQDQLRSSLNEILEAAQIPETDILDLPVTRKHKIKVRYSFR